MASIPVFGAFNPCTKFARFFLTLLLSVWVNAFANDLLPIGEKFILPESHSSSNPIAINEIRAEIKYGDKVGSYTWIDRNGQNFELKHSLEIKLKDSTYIVRPNFNKDYSQVSSNLTQYEVYLDDHLTGFNYGYSKGILVLQGVADGASSPYIEWMVLKVDPSGKGFSSMKILVPSCMGSSIPALWAQGEVEKWNYDISYAQYRAIELTNLDTDSEYEIKTYHGPGSLLEGNFKNMGITEYPIEFFEIGKSGRVAVDNNPNLYKPFYEIEKLKGHTWQSFYYGVRAGLVKIEEYQNYGISQEKAESLDKDIHRDCNNNSNLYLHKVTAGVQK